MSAVPSGTRIHVDRCTVTVRRRGGWSWGDPQELVDGALAAVEAALVAAAEQSGLDPADDVVLTGPVRLVVRRDGSVAPAPGGGSVSEHLADRLADRLADSLEQQRRAATAAPSPPGAEDPGGPQSRAPGALPASDLGPVALGHGLALALGRLSRGGALAEVLKSGSARLLAGWLEALSQACVDAAAPRPWPDEALDAVCRRVLGTAVAEPLDPAGRALLVVGALLAAADGQLPSSGTLMRLRRTIASLPVAGGDPRATAEPDRSVTPPGAGPAVSTAPARSRRSVAPEEPPPVSQAPAVVPALPFLVVLQLQRLDYLAPAAAVLHLAGAADAAGHERLAGADRALAAMLAGKALPSPSGGWRREGPERDAVALVAGVAAHQVDELVRTWSRPARDAVPALDALLTVLDGRDADRSASAQDALAARRGLPGLEEDGCERHLAAAVATALDRLALELWGEEADALLALTRLEDLEARVVVTSREVSIGLPRGQRWLDLRRIGLLDAWRVPWAAGGRWELVTW